MLKCEDVQNELQSFLNNEIGKSQRGQIKVHIENCENCSQALQQLKKLSEFLQVWESPAPSPMMWDKLKRRIGTREFSQPRVFTRLLVKKIVFQITEVAAVVVLTLSVSHWLREPQSQIQDDSATLNFYLREHKDVAAQLASFDPSPPPAARMDVYQHDILYYEFLDDPYELGRPGIIVRGPSSIRQTGSPVAPAIANGHALTLAEARKAVNFNLVSPPRLHPGYMLDQIRRIDGRDTLHLLYNDGINTISLFEQPLDGSRGLLPADFREYAVYCNKGLAGGTILAWRDIAVSYVLVGNAEMSQLMDMAQSISPAK